MTPSSGAQEGPPSEFCILGFKPAHMCDLVGFVARIIFFIVRTIIIVLATKNYNNLTINHMWLLITFVKYLAPNVREEQRMQAAGPLTSCRSLGFDKHKTFGPPP